MKIIEQSKETVSIFEALCGIILKESASALTQGLIGHKFENALAHLRP